MVSLRTKGSFLKLYGWLPILILFISVFFSKILLASFELRNAFSWYASWGPGVTIESNNVFVDIDSSSEEMSKIDWDLYEGLIKKVINKEQEISIKPEILGIDRLTKKFFIFF